MQLECVIDCLLFWNGNTLCTLWSEKSEAKDYEGSGGGLYYFMSG